MTFLELKCGYWSSRFAARPVAFTLDKTLFSLLLFVLVLQIMSDGAGLPALAFGRRLPVWIAACGLCCFGNIIQLLYFPSLLDRMIGNDFFHLYPMSTLQLNSIRFVESLFTKTSLLTANIMYSPTLEMRNDHTAWLFFILTILLLRMLSIFITDVLRLVGRRHFFTLAFLTFGGLSLVRCFSLTRRNTLIYYDIYEATRNAWVCLSVILILFLLSIRLSGLRIYKNQYL